MMVLLLLINIWCWTPASPVVLPNAINVADPGSLSGSIQKLRSPCALPRSLGRTGIVVFFEDCKSTDRFSADFPAALPSIGIHPLICCPLPVDSDSICFPSDPWCSTYEAPAAAEPVNRTSACPASSGRGDKSRSFIPLETEEDVGDVAKSADSEYLDTSHQDLMEALPMGVPTMQSRERRQCSEGAPCTSLSRCSLSSDYLAEPGAPLNTIVCGLVDNELKICCPKESIAAAPLISQPPPRFPKLGVPRDCNDQDKLCPTWGELGACELNRHFILGGGEEELQVESSTMFTFMMAVCPETCGWCGKKGCVDELSACVGSAREGACISGDSNMMMVHTCRESCGVCGFLTSSNLERQRTADGGQVSDITSPYNFRCDFRASNTSGTSTTTKGTTTTTTTTTKTTAKSTANLKKEKTDDNEHDDDGLFFYFSSKKRNATAETFCASITISDQWVITAAHCTTLFGKSAEQMLVTRSSTGEVVELKRIFRHPLFKWGKAYNDIALAQLGRKLDFINNEEGPVCIDNGLILEREYARAQGYGITPDGTKGQITKYNVTIISDKECKDRLNNAALRPSTRRKLNKALPYGLDYGLVCSVDKFPELLEGEVVHQGPCQGDSGGPLIIQDDQGRDTLVGIVNGGLDCWKGTPDWYTRIRFYRLWIDCILNSKGEDQDEIKERCKKAVKQEPEEKSYIFQDTGDF